MILCWICIWNVVRDNAEKANRISFRKRRLLMMMMSWRNYKRIEYCVCEWNICFRHQISIVIRAAHTYFRRIRNPKWFIFELNRPEQEHNMHSMQFYLFPMDVLLWINTKYCIVYMLPSTVMWIRWKFKRCYAFYY